MLPNLRNGQLVLVFHRSEPSEGDVVIAKHPTTGAAIIKRVVKIEADGYWLEGDAHDPATAAASQDSWVFGAVPRESITGTLIFPKV
ncbi:MAG: hypothetical protein RLZZ426_896 [Actinomycetota bacterium]|jgi:hypothetical protein